MKPRIFTPVPGPEVKLADAHSAMAVRLANAGQLANLLVNVVNVFTDFRMGALKCYF